jgi:hypothetical protein
VAALGGSPDVATPHWRSSGIEPLPPASEALNQPFRAFPSWFLRIECERCGKATMINEAHTGERRGRASGAAHWRRRRVQPPGAADRAADGIIRWMSHISQQCQPWPVPS